MLAVCFNLLLTAVPSYVWVRRCGCYLRLHRMTLLLLLCFCVDDSSMPFVSVCACVSWRDCKACTLWSSAGTLGLQYKHTHTAVVMCWSCSVLATGCAFIVSVSDLWVWWLLFLLLKVGLCKCIITQDYRGNFNLPLLWKRQINNSEWMICADR